MGAALADVSSDWAVPSHAWPPIGLALRCTLHGLRASLDWARGAPLGTHELPSSWARRACWDETRTGKMAAGGDIAVILKLHQERPGNRAGNLRVRARCLSANCGGCGRGLNTPLGNRIIRLGTRILMPGIAGFVVSDEPSGLPRRWPWD